MMKKALSLIMCAVLAFSVCAMPAAALTVLPLDSARAVAEREIQAFAASDDPMVTWNSSTQISSAINLYDLDDNINGYIYKLTTNGEQTGYIQVGKFGAGYSVMMLSFEGDHMVESKLEQNSISTNTLRAQKVYFAGNFDYFVAQDEGLLDLTTGEVCTNVAAVRTAYTNYLASVTPSVTENTARSTNSTYSVGTTVNVSNITSNHLKTMKYFRDNGLVPDGVGHCGPTAGANIVLYWANSREISALERAPEAIFNDLFNAMETGTGGVTGTKISNIKPAMDSYFSAHYSTPAYVSYDYKYYPAYSDGSSAAENFERICYFVQNDLPGILCVNNWDGDIGHGVNVWGYNTGGTNEYLFITHNQDQKNTGYPSYTLMDYSVYTYGRFSYYGYR